MSSSVLQFAMDTLTLFNISIFFTFLPLLLILFSSPIFYKKIATKSLKKQLFQISSPIAFFLKNLHSSKTIEASPSVERLAFVKSSFEQKQVDLPSQFQWPEDLLVPAQDELDAPVIDLTGFLRGDSSATAVAVELVRRSCTSHGFFQVTNHGVDAELLRAAEEELDVLFKLPLEEKMKLKKIPGDTAGYTGAHADRFQTNLPWKECITFNYRAMDPNTDHVVEYVKSGLGDDFEHIGRLYQKYCEVMNKLIMSILELLAISLGVDSEHYKNFYEDNNCMLRCNYYPPCQNPGLTLGTGPHSDPTSVTLLHQDQVGGLEVFSDNKWRSVRPLPGAFVINIGDTFMALTNGKYKSCLHRALVNTDKERKSLAFFLNPNFDKVVRPPQVLVSEQCPRKYPDFTWSEFLNFTQFHYRSDGDTLKSFVEWSQSKSG